MKLNNKGFTLVELLAVIVILTVISSIAIPTISSSLDRSKTKQTKAKEDLLKSAAELYIIDNNKRGTIEGCVTFTKLKNSGYIDDKATDDVKGCSVQYTPANGSNPATYTIATNCTCSW